MTSDQQGCLTPFARPIYLMAKPAGAACNLACGYCYYLEKKQLYSDVIRSTKSVMSDATLEQFIKQYIEAQRVPVVSFTWHGGEALMRPVEFYERVIELQRKYAGGRQIDNCLQTNATLLDERWCRFFKENGWLVGVSVDGPKEFHDEYRRDRLKRPSFDRVMRGIELLNTYGVEWNALAVVNDYNADYPLEFYDFFKQIGCRYIQFTPIVERVKNGALAGPGDDDAAVAPFSVSPRQWGDFLCAVFDQWVRNDVGSTFVQLFDATLANWVGVSPGLCTMGRSCGLSGAVEHNGDVYACDHFVYPDYKLGNLHQDNLVEMMDSDAATRFAEAKMATLPDRCRQCEYLFACNGECPKNRFATAPDGTPGLNYLCEGYRRFFAHAAPYFDYMKQELLAKRPASNVMTAFP